METSVSSPNETFPKTQRIGWIGISLLLAIGMLGFLGPGLLSSRIVASPPLPMQLEIQRVVQLLSPTTMKVHLSNGAAESGKVRITLNQEYAQALGLREIIPLPDAVESMGTKMVFTFNVTETPATLLFNFEPEESWQHRAEVGLVGVGTLAFNQFVFP